MSPVLLRTRAVTVALTTGVVVLGGVVASSPASAAAPRASISGTLPSWAATSDQTKAPAVTAGTVNARIYLAGVDPAGLTAYATAVSTPGNPLYGHYLGAAEVRARYGPTRTQIAAIKSWVRASGLRVTGVDDEMAGYVSVTGSVANAHQAFGVTFGRFKAPDGTAYMLRVDPKSGDLTVERVAP